MPARAVVSQDMSRLETVSGHYFSKSRSRRSEVSISSRYLEVLENGHVSAVSFISPMELFQHLNMPKESYFKAVFCTIIYFKTHIGNKVTNKYNYNDVVILISTEEH